MSQITQEIVENIITPYLTAIGGFVVDIALKGDSARENLRISVDTDPGITIEQCAELNRHLHEQLNSAGINIGKISIEVTSPGLDAGLKVLRQYQKNIGREFRTWYKTEQGLHEIKGLILAVNGTIITFETQAGTTDIAHEAITKCVETLPW